MAQMEARFGHVNLTGRDWRRLAAFYTDNFGCEYVPPERDIRGEHLDAATGLRGAHLTGNIVELQAWEPAP
jgi:catechol 2,3-dioxygenase-like lactoylglutathione lyase family enzyme